MKSICFSLSLLICMYKLARNILSQSCCSLCSYVCVGLPGPADPHKVKFSVSLSLCLYVCMNWPEIFCLKAVVLSARMYVLAFQDQQILTKWNILSNCLLIYQQRENISLWEGVLVLEGQYYEWGNKSFETEYFWPIHTYIRAKREQASHRAVVSLY